MRCSNRRKWRRWPRCSRPCAPHARFCHRYPLQRRSGSRQDCADRCPQDNRSQPCRQSLRKPAQPSRSRFRCGSCCLRAPGRYRKTFPGISRPAGCRTVSRQGRWYRSGARRHAAAAPARPRRPQGRSRSDPQRPVRPPPERLHSGAAPARPLPTGHSRPRRFPPPRAPCQARRQAADRKKARESTKKTSNAMYPPNQSAETAPQPAKNSLKTLPAGKAAPQSLCQRFAQIDDIRNRTSAAAWAVDQPLPVGHAGGLTAVQVIGGRTSQLIHQL